MRSTRRTMRAGLAAVMALAATMAVGPQATAAEPCRANGLCLYYSTGFNDMRFVTERTGRCSELVRFGLVNHVFSYRNNLPVTVQFLDGDNRPIWSIRPGGSSSDSRSFGGEVLVCT